MLELYHHYPIHLHDVEIYELSTGTTLPYLSERAGTAWETSKSEIFLFNSPPIPKHNAFY
jgi:hypothetical protein